jgi:hypothetical protein
VFGFVPFPQRRNLPDDSRDVKEGAKGMIDNNKPLLEAGVFVLLGGISSLPLSHLIFDPQSSRFNL